MPKETEGNGCLALVEYVLLPSAGLRTGKREWIVERERDGLEPLVYNDIKKVNEDYVNDVVWTTSYKLQLNADLGLTVT